MVVCLCKGIGDRALRQCIREGARSLHEVGSGCGAGTDCGACRGMIRDIIEEETEGRPSTRVHLPIAAE